MRRAPSSSRCYDTNAATIWTNKAADIATAHVALGALSLVIGAMVTLVTWRAARRTAGLERDEVLDTSLAPADPKAANLCA